MSGSLARRYRLFHRKRAVGGHQRYTWEDALGDYAGVSDARYMSFSEIDRWRAVPFDMPPPPERGAVMQRVRQLVEGLDGALDEGTASALDRYIEAQAAAPGLGIKLQSLGVQTPDDFKRVFQDATRRRTGALLVLDDFLLTRHVRQIAALTVKNRLPAIAGIAEFAEAGGLVVYGPNFPDVSRRAATYVDKILKGAKPGDLPIEQPTKFDLVVNLKTAKTLGLTIPQSLLLRADELIR